MEIMSAKFRELPNGVEGCRRAARADGRAGLKQGYSEPSFPPPTAITAVVCC